MSKETEKFFKELLKYVEENNFDDNFDVNEVMNDFLDEYENKDEDDDIMTSDDYLEMAWDCDSADEALEYVETAISLDPDNFDATVFKIGLTAESLDEEIGLLEDEAERAKDIMTEKGYMADENYGDFYQIFGTRPYIRLLALLCDDYISSGRFKKAMGLAEEIVFLNNEDNLGYRYKLAHLYALYEDEESLLDLADTYKSRRKEPYDTQFLMCLTLLYYKKADYDKARMYLLRLSKLNHGLKKLFTSVHDGTIEDKIYNLDDEYQINTLEELIVEFKDNSYVFLSSFSFLNWCERVLKENKKNNKNSKKMRA